MKNPTDAIPENAAEQIGSEKQKRGFQDMGKVCHGRLVTTWAQ